MPCCSKASLRHGSLQVTFTDFTRILEKSCPETKMLLQLLKHQWKETLRSVLWHRSIATNIFLGIILTLFLLNALSIGLYIDTLLTKMFPDRDPVRLFNSVLLYYFGMDLILRFYLQKTSGLKIEPYLLLPVSRKVMVHYILLKSLVTVFNLYPLLILIPVAVQIIIPGQGALSSFVWLLTCLLLMTANGLWTYYASYTLQHKPIRILVSAIILLLVIGSDYSGLINVSTASSYFFGAISAKPYLIIVPLLYLVFSYRIPFRFFRKHLYLMPFRKVAGNNKRKIGAYSFLDRFGEVGLFIALELKLLVRNKRTRAALGMSVTMILIAPLFYFSMQNELNPYPVPDHDVNETIMARDGYSSVTFHVEPGMIPPGAHVYVTGDQANLGPWKPDSYPMAMNPDSSWSRTFLFKNETKFRYIHTLGSWATEICKAGTTEPDVRTHAVYGDTTLVWAHPSWKVPQRSGFLDAMMVYIGLLFSGILLITYGQFLLAWESNYFDLLLSRGLIGRNYFLAKYILLVAFGLLFFVFTIPLLFFSKTIFILNTALAIYNIGVNALLVLFLAAFNRKYMDLEASILSTQGKGSVNYLLIIPAIILPLILFLIIRAVVGSDTGYMVLSALGIVGLFSFRPALNLIEKHFNRHKYAISAGFHQL